MIYEFKCRATGTVVMTQAVAERILQTIGKPAEAKGIITQAQMGPAIDALRQAVTKQRDEQTCLPGISFSQRAQPFIEMLERAQSAGRDVTWGV
jgi:cyclopropane-fatty-acyl-phospholipid synthase